MKHDDNVLDQIRKQVGKPVTFTYPGGEGRKYGTLKDRAIVVSNPGTTGVPYWDVVDLIEFPEEAEPTWIRIGYYRKPNDRLIWGSQTTITEPIETWRRLLTEAAKQKPWFKALIQQVADDLKK